MELPDLDGSSGTYLKYTDHFSGAVEGWSDAEIITADQRSVITNAGGIVDSAANGLRNAQNARLQAERFSTQLRARFNIRDIILDKRVMSTSDAVLNGPAMRDRQSPVYRAVFQDGNAGDITEVKMRDEPEAAERMLERFTKIAEFDGKDRAKADLDEALTKSLNTRDSLDAAESAERSAGDAELQARLAVRAALEQAYGMLRAAFAGQRKLVESFFYRAERRAKKPQPV